MYMHNCMCIGCVGVSVHDRVFVNGQCICIVVCISVVYVYG